MPRAEVEIGQPRTATMEKDSSKSNISQHSGSGDSMSVDHMPALNGHATDNNHSGSRNLSECEIEIEIPASSGLRAMSTPPHIACSDTPVAEGLSGAKLDASSPRIGGLHSFT